MQHLIRSLEEPRPRILEGDYFNTKQLNSRQALTSILPFKDTFLDLSPLTRRIIENSRASKGLPDVEPTIEIILPAENKQE